MSDSDDHSDLIRTHSVARGIAEAAPVVLVTTATTRVVFKPMILGQGVRGHLVKQKIGAGGEWLDINEVDFRSVDPDAGVKIEITTEGTSLLFESLERLYQVQGQGVQSGTRTYAVGPADEMVRIADRDAAAAIRQMVAQGHSLEMWNELAAADPSLADRLAASHMQVSREDAIREFAQALFAHPADEDFWQEFLWEHRWMLQCASAATVYVIDGETYVGGKLPLGRTGRGGVATDFVTSDASTKSFGVVEIKTPAAHLIGPRYRGTGTEDLETQNDVYSMHVDFTGAVVQTRNQVTVAVENFRTTLAQHPSANGLNRLHPKGILIAGLLDGMNERQQASFNQFRHGQHSLTIITFDELLRRLSITYELDPRAGSASAQPERSAISDGRPQS